MKLEIELNKKNVKKLEAVCKELGVAIDSDLINTALEVVPSAEITKLIVESLKSQLQKALDNKSNLAKLAKALKKD